MAAEKDPQEIVKKYVADLHSLEEHGHKAISRQVDQLKNSEHPDAHRATVEFKQKLESHIMELEQRLKALGGNPSSAVQDAAGAVAGVVAGAYNALRSEGASKSIRDDYTFFSHVAIASFMLHTTTMGFGDHETARIAEMIYKDAAGCVERIDLLMPGLVLEELRQDGHQMRDVTDECKQLLREAWRGSSDSVKPAATPSPSSTMGT